ncbi:MAG: restriction endonuclease subunit S, partial [Planctomycetaceae bacterium]|nr:restriction endonuclease subunit S [Planctomycetaceae bacterium]
MIAQAHGGVGLRHITKGKLEALPIPLPPLAEQKRIVAKVDELMGLLDELDRQQAQREEVRQAACVSVLHHLTAPTDEDDQPTKPAPWPRLQRNFNTLIQTPTDVQELRKTILQLAVTGRLVEQDESDESADDLLNKIDATKAERIASGELPKSAKNKNDSAPILNWDIPVGWAVTNLNRVCSLVTDGEHLTPTRVSYEAVPLVTAKNVRDGSLDMNNTDFVSEETAEKCWRRCQPQHLDILMVCVGATTGRLTVVRNPPEMVIVRSVALFRPFSDYVDSDYLAVVLRSPHGQKQVWGGVKQSAQPCLYISKSKGIAIPLPPLAEQGRIVSRVNELMTLCDQLEQQLTDHQTTATQLTESLIAGVLNGGEGSGQ